MSQTTPTTSVMNCKHTRLSLPSSFLSCTDYELLQFVSSSCRPVGYPYWFGLLLPSALSSAVAFLLVFLAPCPQSCYPRAKDDSSTWAREYIGLVLSLTLFCITWGFGIPATHHLNIGIARVIFQAIFITGSVLLGSTVFLFFCLLSPEVRKKWTGLISKVCLLPGHRRRHNLTYDDNSHPAEQSIYMTQYDLNATELETNSASPGVAEISTELQFTNSLANDAMDDEMQATDSSDTKL